MKFRDDFDHWRKRVIELGEGYTTLDADTMVSWASPKVIYKEYRFFVVDKQIVGESIYKIGNKIVYQPLVEDDARTFAQQMIDLWQPARAFVLDVAMVPDGYKVVEINCINSAGFYAIDVAKFVMAIEAMEFLIQVAGAFFFFEGKTAPECFCLCRFKTPNLPRWFLRHIHDKIHPDGIRASRG